MIQLPVRTCKWPKCKQRYVAEENDRQRCLDHLCRFHYDLALVMRNIRNGEKLSIVYKEAK